MIANIKGQVQYQKSWFKQESMEFHFKKETLLVPNKNYLVIDQTTDYDENERGLSHWALSGLLKKAFNQENRFAITVKDRQEYRPNTEFQYYILIENGELILNSNSCIKLLYQYYFDKEKYLSNIKKILKCKVLPYNPNKKNQ